MSLINQMLQDLEQRKLDERCNCRPGTCSRQTREIVVGKVLGMVVFYCCLPWRLARAFWFFGMPAEQAMQPTPFPAIVSAPQIAAPKPAPQPDYSPSVLQLASELSFMPSSPPAGQEIKVARFRRAAPVKQESSPSPVVEKPLPGRGRDQKDRLLQ